MKLKELIRALLGTDRAALCCELARCRDRLRHSGALPCHPPTPIGAIVSVTGALAFGLLDVRDSRAWWLEADFVRTALTCKTSGQGPADRSRPIPTKMTVRVCLIAISLVVVGCGEKATPRALTAADVSKPLLTRESLSESTSRLRLRLGHPCVIVGALEAKRRRSRRAGNLRARRRQTGFTHCSERSPECPQTAGIQHHVRAERRTRSGCESGSGRYPPHPSVIAELEQSVS